MVEPRSRVTPVSGIPGAEELIAASPTALLILSPDLEICQVNGAAEILLNRSAMHLVGQPIRSAINLPASFDDKSEAAFAAYDLALMTPRGIKFRADLLITPLPDSFGWRLVSLQAGAAAHRIGHRLEGGSGVKTAVGIAAMLAHEIKNPLSGIRGAAQLIERHVDDNAKKLTQLIRTEVDRIAALIDRMEGFTDSRTLELAAENIHAIIDHARAVAMSGFGKNLKISDAYDPSLPPVLVHKDSLTQVIINLLKNASETAREGERRGVVITTAYRHGVSAAHDDGRGRHALPVELCIMDDGPGAPADIADHLFDPFVSSKRNSQGLGLALVDKLVRDMGGLIQYAREGDPPMTVFRMLLPRADGKLK